MPKRKGVFFWEGFPQWPCQSIISWVDNVLFLKSSQHSRVLTKRLVTFPTMEQWSDEKTWPTKWQGTRFNVFDVWPQVKTISHTIAPVNCVTCIAILFVEFSTQLKYGKKSQEALFQNVKIDLLVFLKYLKSYLPRRPPSSSYPCFSTFPNS